MVFQRVQYLGHITIQFHELISKLETRLSSLTCYICMLVKNPLMSHLNSLGKHSFSARNFKVARSGVF